MNKIGTTSAGMVIVEMTASQFDALQQFTGSDGRTEPPVRSEAPAIALKRKLAYVRSCLLKIQPANRDELFRSVKALFHSSGGISDSETNQILHILEKESFIVFGEDGEVRFAREEETPVPALVEE
ncbi:MAG: hypothetical protein ACP5I4_14690 [Oceanipulchritudo sp.]